MNGPADADDLAVRRAAWEALSDLYLDTDVDALRPSVARRLAALPLSLDEIEHILLREVHPVLCANLLAVAGVWTAFDPDWLAATIQRHRARPKWRRLADRFLRGEAQRQWRLLAPLVRAAREASGTTTLPD